jgi:ABC-type transport system substrate-binding protein
LVQVNPAYQEAVISNIVGDLAERWDISPDGTKYTFYLVKNAKWHDGKPFTADDVIYSLDKIMDTKAGSRMAGTLEAMKDYTKVDDYTVVMNTKYPSPGFLVNVANPYNVIQPKHMAGKDNKSTDFLVGTGPFKFKEYIPESSFSLVRNPDYFKKDKNGVQLPYLDGITIYIMKAGGVDAFIAKKLDMVNPMQLVATKSDYDKIRASAPDARLFEVRANTPYCIWLNLKSALLRTPRFSRPSPWYLIRRTSSSPGWVTLCLVNPTAAFSALPGQTRCPRSRRSWAGRTPPANSSPMISASRKLSSL